MAIDFPNSPTTNQTFTVGTRTWIWDGTTWELVATSSDPIQKTIVDAKGDLIAGTTSDAVARLAVGTNGQVLTADSAASTGLKWATAPSSGLVYITSSTFSGATTVSVDNCFTSTYENYLVLLRIDTVSANSRRYIRLRASSTDTTVNYGLNTSVGAGYNQSTALNGDPSNIQAIQIGYLETTIDDLVSSIVFHQPQLAKPTFVTYHGVSDAASFYMGGGQQTDNTQFDGFTVLSQNGTITGNLRVYAYANS